jgi:hypothetical protein
VNGDYEKNRPQKPTGATFAPIYDPTDPDTAINYWTVLDDPQMPIFFEYTLYPGTQSIHVQSSIPGRVVDSVALRGVANADVSIDGLDVVARSWSDGTFVLPPIDKPYREFSLSVKAPQYADLTTKRDFRAADAFPVALTMERTVDAGHPNYIVIFQGTLEMHAADLRERLTGRSADIISEALQTDHGLIVLIPTFDVYGPFAKADAWLEVNMRTCEIYGRLMDGLYGGTIEPPPPYAGQQGAVEYFMGNTAGWYLAAAGALTAVNVAIEVPSITNDEMYKVAMLAAERMEEEIYNVAGFEGAESFGEVSDIVASVLSGELSAIPAAVGTAVVGSKAFEAGLKRGLGTMAKAMKQAWGVGGSGG